VIECTACHTSGSLPTNTMNGPHGMHQVGSQAFVNGHENLAEHHTEICMPCHGTDLLGTPLSKMRATRTFSTEHGSVTLQEGEIVSCTRCHSKPN